MDELRKPRGGDNRRALSQRELTELRDLYEGGEKFSVIEARLNIGNRRVHSELERMGVPPRNWPRKTHRQARLSDEMRERAIADYRDTDEAPEAIAEAYGISRSRLYSELDRAGVPRRQNKRRASQQLSPDRLQTIRDMYEAGDSLTEIQSVNGINYAVLYDVLAQMNVPRRAEEYERRHFDHEFRDRLSALYGDPTLTLAEVCTALGLTEENIYRLLDHWKIPRRRNPRGK